MSWHEMINLVFLNIKNILKITLIATILLFIILFFLYPKTYYSFAKILPPNEETGLSGLGSLLSGSDVSSLLLSGKTQGNSQLYMEILRSRSAAEYVVKKLNLFEYLNSDDLHEAAIKLSDDLDLNLSKEGIVTISVKVTSSVLPYVFSDTDSLKTFSALLSNTYIEALDKINNKKRSTKAKRAREFIEEQLIVTKTALDTAEMNLMLFQKKNKTVSLPDQLKSVIESAARLKNEITIKEIELGLLKNNFQSNSKTIIAEEQKLEQLNDQYQKLNIGEQDYLLAFNDVPEMGRKLAEIYREVKIQNELYLFLQQQYYREKIQENKDIPTIEVLDVAIPPIKQSSPRVVYLSIVGTFFIFTILSVFFIIKEKKLNL